MDTNSDPFEKHRKIIEHLIIERFLDPLTSWYLHSTLFYLEVVAQGYDGSLNEEQQYTLKIAASYGKDLQKRLDLFVTASRLMFKPPQLNLNEFDLLEEVSQFINLLETDTKFQIEKILPIEPALLKADKDLIRSSFKNIKEIILQIHPIRFGNIHITVKNQQDVIEVDIIVHESETFYSMDENPELFIVQSIAKLHDGEFSIADSNGAHSLSLTLPVKQN